jgi:hypothetical protein
MTSNPETEAATPAKANGPKHPKAAVGKRARNVAPAKAKTSSNASPVKKAPKGVKKATEARDGSKSAQILDLLERPGGATSRELQKASGWQPHSVRGFLSGTVRKKLGLAVTSTKGENGERSYAVKA